VVIRTSFNEVNEAVVVVVELLHQKKDLKEEGPWF
jgi:hypothetical protein